MYKVSLFDCAGEFCSFDCATFPEAVRCAIRLDAWPGKVLQVSNLDRCDIDTLGLTEDEEEALSVALDAATKYLAGDVR